jgi:hypothetical protein
MKKVVLSFIVVVLLFNTTASAAEKKETIIGRVYSINKEMLWVEKKDQISNREIEINELKKAEVKGIVKNKFDYAYVWLIFNDGCLYLFRLNDPGYIDAQGVLHTGYSLTRMTEQNFVGTNTVCPPTGQYYC